MEEDKGKVCVTGGTGYVASWLIMTLLQHGYSVRATVRFTPGKKKDLSFLTNLPKAKKKLEIFDADLDQPDSFNEAIEGCIGVFHIAHPMDVDGNEAEETVTKRSVEGLLGILKASLNSKTVKIVVYTSTAAAVMNSYEDINVMDENTWSDLDFCRNVNKIVSPSYTVSKTITEKTALDFAEKHGLDVVTLVLSTVAGPFICPNLPTSLYMTLNMIFGKLLEAVTVVTTATSCPTLCAWDPNTHKPMLWKQDGYRYVFYVNYLVHIDDVANAHVFLLESPNAKGRYICSSAEMLVDEMHDFLSTKYPELQLPTQEQIREIKQYKFSSLSSKKLLDSGFKYRYGVDDMLHGAIQSCKEKGLI